MRQLLLFRTRHQPYMVRRTYRYEMRSALTFPLASSLAEGSFTAVVAAKFFEASAVLIAVIAAAPMFGNILAILWSELSRGRPKVRFVNILQGGVVLCIATVATTAWLPRGSGGGAGGWCFAALIILARMLASGIVTVRSAIWRSNYPRQLRGQIIARISVVATAVLAITTLGGSWWLDHNPLAFIYLYPLAASLGAVGIWQFSHIRVRRERQELRRHGWIYVARPEGMSQTDETNVMNYQPAPRPSGLRGFFTDARQVMRDDALFRRYQWWQFLSGVGFMMLAAPLQYMVSTEMTDPQTQYLMATLVLQIIPMLTTIAFTQVWAPLFDRTHVVRFRVIQNLVAAGGMGLLWTGAVAQSLAMVALGQFFMGISTAGGNLAWNLGHNDFCPPEKSPTYMGVHVMLTGLRGCVAPFVGVALYNLPWVGRGVFGMAFAFSLAAMVGFATMSRSMPRKPVPGEVHSR